MPEQCVIVKSDLRVQSKQPPVSCSNERIDLQQGSVGFKKCSVKRSQKLHRRINLLRAQPQLERNLPRLKPFQAHPWIDMLLQNRFWILGGNFLNLHSAGRRRHEYWFAFYAIHEDSEVKFLLDRESLFDQQAPHNAPLWS